MNKTNTGRLLQAPAVRACRLAATNFSSFCVIAGFRVLYYGALKLFGTVIDLRGPPEGLREATQQFMVLKCV